MAFFDREETEEVEDDKLFAVWNIFSNPVHEKEAADMMKGVSGSDQKLRSLADNALGKSTALNNKVK